MKKVFLLSAFILVSLSAIQAQNSFSLFFGGAFPTGDFSESDMDKEHWGLLGNDRDGGAGVGFDIGLQWNFGIQNVNGLGIILSVDGIINTLNSDVKDFFEDLEDEFEEEEYDDYELKTPKYLNFPIMVGANYTYKVNDNLGLYGEAAMGFNLRKITDIYCQYEYDAVHYDDYGYVHYYTKGRTQTYEYDLSTSFAYRLGAGFVFNDKYNLGVSFWNLGAAKVKGTSVSEKNSYDSYDKSKNKFKYKDITPTMVMVRFGIKF